MPECFSIDACAATPRTLFVCSINQQYIPSMLPPLDDVIDILGRQGLRYEELPAGPDARIYPYPYERYTLATLCWRMPGIHFYKKIYFPTYSVETIPTHFTRLMIYSMFCADKTIFIDVYGAQRTFSRWQLAWYLVKHLVVSGSWTTGKFIYRFHGSPFIAKIPQTLRTVFELFRPGGFGMSNKHFFSFGLSDTARWSWYNKIARDHQKYGRFGYAWDDGLGMPIGGRMHNTACTYWLLYHFGMRMLMACGYGCMVVMSSIVAGLMVSPLVGIVMGVLLAGSPFLISMYTREGKPEMIWWGWGIIFVVLLLTIQGMYGGIIAGLVWSALVFVNAPVSVMLAVLLGPTVIVQGLPLSALAGLSLGVLPGFLKSVVRGVYALRTGFGHRVVNEQLRLKDSPWWFSSYELQWLIPFALSIIISASVSHDYGFATALVGVGCIAGWLNNRIIRLNDYISFILYFFVVAYGYACAQHSLLGLLPLLSMAYVHPRFLNLDLPRNDFKAAYERYPGVVPCALPQPAKLVAFLKHIPNGVRCIIESDGDSRTATRYRAFRQWTDSLLPQRNIDIVNEIFTQVNEPELSMRYLNMFNAEHLPSAKMMELSGALGVSYIIAFTDAMAALLSMAGCTLVAMVVQPVEDKKSFYPVPPVLHLFRCPQANDIIEPAVSWRRDGNTLSWDATAETNYIVRYRYDRYFQACQGSSALTVKPFRPLPDIPLTFMQVTARCNGYLEFSYHAHML